MELAEINRIIESHLGYVRVCVWAVMDDRNISNTWKRGMVDDIAQGAILRLCVALRSYDPSRPVKPLICAVVKRHALNELSAHYVTRTVLSEDFDDKPDPGPTPAKCAEVNSQLESALERLQSARAALVARGMVEGLQGQEIAARLNVSPATVTREQKALLAALED